MECLCYDLRRASRIGLSFTCRTGAFFFLSSHSHMRITIQPRASNAAVISASCLIFRCRFAIQYSLLCSGRVFLQSCPCQKQPSTKTAIRSRKNTKSGCPLTLYCLLHPLIPCSLNISIRRSSVVLLAVGLTAFITDDLCAGENTSLINYHPLASVCFSFSFGLEYMCKPQKPFIYRAQFRNPNTDRYLVSWQKQCSSRTSIAYQLWSFNRSPSSFFQMTRGDVSGLTSTSMYAIIDRIATHGKDVAL